MAQAPTFISLLKEWQDLAGATLGGLTSLVVALIVAHIPMRREDLTAAMLVISNLVPARARHSSLKALAQERAIPVEEYPFWLSEKLLQSRPKLTPTYDAAAMRVMATDVHIASHLATFDLTIREMDEKLDRLAADFQAKRMGQPALRSLQATKADARLLAAELDRLAEHANCAEQLITALVLSRARAWNRLRRKFRISAKEKLCLERLK
jgi:hypothetical protein